MPPHSEAPPIVAQRVCPAQAVAGAFTHYAAYLTLLFQGKRVGDITAAVLLLLWQNATQTCQRNTAY